MALNILGAMGIGKALQSIPGATPVAAAGSALSTILTNKKTI